MAKKKAAPFDGFGPRERQYTTNAIRQVWYRSKARKEVIKRCTDKEGFLTCEKCNKRTPKIQVDHIKEVGPIESDGAILRMFIPSNKLRGLCPPCHRPITAAQRKKRVKKKEFWED